MTSGALPAANALFRSSWKVAWWSSQLTLTPGYVPSKRAIVSAMYLSKVGDRKNVHRPISALASTLGMTASAGSTASGAAEGDAAAADGSVLAGACDAGACEAGALADGAAVGVQAMTARIAARANARVRFVCINSPSTTPFRGVVARSAGAP